MPLHALKLKDKAGDCESHYQHASSECDDGGYSILAFASAASAEDCRQGLIANWNLGHDLVVVELPASLIEDVWSPPEESDEPEPVEQYVSAVKFSDSSRVVRGSGTDGSSFWLAFGSDGRNLLTDDRTPGSVHFFDIETATVALKAKGFAVGESHFEFCDASTTGRRITEAKIASGEMLAR